MYDDIPIIQLSSPTRLTTHLSTQLSLSNFEDTTDLQIYNTKKLTYDDIPVIQLSSLPIPSSLTPLPLETSNPSLSTTETLTDLQANLIAMKPIEELDYNTILKWYTSKADSVATEPLEEKYLEYVAKERGIDKAEAARYIDRYIKFAAAKLNVEYSEIYKLLYTEEALENCLSLNKSCSALELEECKKSCHCFYLEKYGCLPRKIPDADLINEDPDKYIKSNLGKEADLERMVEIAAYLYYNYDGGGLTDNAFDALEHHLNRKKRLKGRLYEKIGAPPVEKIRTDLPYPLPSLNKVKPGEKGLIRFLEQFQTETFLPKPDLMWSLKLDGVSGMIVYEAGKLSKIYTRGDGSVGGDVTYLKDYITLPQTLVSIKDVVIRGEFILSKSNWKKYNESYANPRSFVAGKINAGYISPGLIDIDFVVYQIMAFENEPVLPEPSQALKILDAEGFNIVEHGLIKKPVMFDIIQLYRTQRNISEYNIDGLVLTSDVRKPAIKPLSEGESAVNPMDTVAFKMTLEEQIRNTKVINVEWNITRHGRYFPKVIFNAVYIEGVRITRSTGHNASHIRNWNMGKGTEITVYRSGDVIPQIKDVTVNEDIEPIYPSDEFSWHWFRKDILLDEIDANPYVQMRRMLYFFETMEVRGLGEKTVEKFWKAGFITAEDVVKASVEDMTTIRGVGKKKAQSFYDGIRKALTTVPPDRFSVASSTFESGIGMVTLKRLFKAIPGVIDMTEKEILNAFKKVKIPGVGKKRSESIARGIPKFREYVYSFAEEEIRASIQNYLDRLNVIKTEGGNPKIAGKIFVLTQFGMKEDYGLKDYIYDHDGNISNKVVNNAEAIIAGNLYSVTKKMETAYEKGIPILSLQEFVRQYNVPLVR